MLELENISLSFGAHSVLNNFSLRLSAGERIALTGPSGCGKTSLLRIIAGLQKPDSGTVNAGTDKISYMFQEVRLLPWLTAAENVNLVLSDSAETLPRAAEWLEKFGMKEAADKYPAQLSGGMQQRTALARTLAAPAELMLLDEPFKAMDEELRTKVIQTVDENCRAALILVTHDEEEARALGCHIIRL